MAPETACRVVSAHSEVKFSLERCCDKDSQIQEFIKRRLTAESSEACLSDNVLDLLPEPLRSEALELVKAKVLPADPERCPLSRMQQCSRYSQCVFP